VNVVSGPGRWAARRSGRAPADRLPDVPAVRAGAAAGEEAAGPSAVKPEPTGAEPAATGVQPAAPSGAVTPPQGLFDIENAFALWVAGGWWMVPITGMSLIMVVVAIERSFALRRKRLMPEELVNQLGQLSGGQGGFDPRQAYRLCQQFPCAASAVLRAMLVKVGRPHSEVEHAVPKRRNGRRNGPLPTSAGSTCAPG